MTKSERLQTGGYYVDSVPKLSLSTLKKGNAFYTCTLYKVEAELVMTMKKTLIYDKEDVAFLELRNLCNITS